MFIGSQCSVGDTWFFQGLKIGNVMEKQSLIEQFGARAISMSQDKANKIKIKIERDQTKFPNFSSKYAGDHMVFFILNMVELVGLVMTFKPFLWVPDEEALYLEKHTRCS